MPEATGIKGLKGENERVWRERGEGERINEGINGGLSCLMNIGSCVVGPPLLWLLEHCLTPPTYPSLGTGCDCCYFGSNEYLPAVGYLIEWQAVGVSLMDSLRLIW